MGGAGGVGGGCVEGECVVGGVLKMVGRMVGRLVGRLVWPLRAEEVTEVVNAAVYRGPAEDGREAVVVEI